MALNEIVLHGLLAERYGSRHRYLVSTPVEAVRALCVNKPGFGDDLAQMEVRVIRTRKGAAVGLELDETGVQLGMSNAELHIVPMPAGSKDGGIGKILLGVFLIGAVIFTGGAALAAAGANFSIGGAIAAGGFLGLSGGTLALAGAAMVLGGVSMMLAPQPETPKTQDQKPSYLFQGAVNMTEQGTPVPLVYGLTLTGSVVVSVGLAAEQINVQTGQTYSGEDHPLLSGVDGSDGEGGTSTTTTGGGVLTTIIHKD